MSVLERLSAHLLAGSMTVRGSVSLELDWEAPAAEPTLWGSARTPSALAVGLLGVMALRPLDVATAGA
jgi:hypothetical protein